MVDQPEIIVGSGKQVQFTAVAYDENRREVPANLTWSFRGLPQGMKYTDMLGHTIAGNGSTATLTVKGMAVGLFKIAAEDETCLSKENTSLFGAAEVNVYPIPSEPALCGPIQVKLGQEHEITNEKVIGFNLFNLKAEIYGPRKLDGYRVRFYVGKESVPGDQTVHKGETVFTMREERTSNQLIYPLHKVSPTDTLIYNKLIKPGMGKEAYYWSYSPVWLAYGNFAGYYELLKSGKPVCSSTITYWTTR